MLAAIVRFSVRFYGVVITATALLFCYAVYQLSQAGLDIFPEFSPKQVIIQTEAAGLSAEQVEVLITQRIENNLAGLVGLTEIRSESIQGLSVVTLIFEEDTDVYRNRQLATERLSNLTDELPAGTGPPVILPLSSSSATIMTIGLTSDTRSLMELRTLVDWTLAPRLLSVPGVADVNIFGGDVRQLQVQVLPDELHRYGLSLQDIVEAAREATGEMGTGFIENRNQRLTLKAVGQPVSAEELARVVLSRQDGTNVLLGEVARVVVGAEPPIGAAAIMEEPGVVIMIIGQYQANTLTVSRNVEAVLQNLQALFEREDITLHSSLFRPANYIENSFASIAGHLMVGAVLVITVLFLFLYNIRTAFISAVAIPLSLLAAASVLVGFGVNLNIMILGGLAIALGEVVDDAIIDTENIFRRLRENSSLDRPLSAGRVIFDASMEIRQSVVYSTFIVALVFVPLLTLGDVTGRLFSPLGHAYILAILASLLVAISVTPALCYLLLRGAGLRDRDPPLIAWLKPGYTRALKIIEQSPRFAIGFTVLVCLTGLAILPSFGGAFLPELREGHYIVHTSSVPGTSLSESIRIGSRLSEQFLQIPGVRSVSQWAGRAERGADTYGSHYSEFEIDLDPLPGKAQQRVFDRIRATLRDFPGILFEANTFLIERVDETISGYTSPVVINIYGSDLDELDRLAQSVAAVMRSVDGAADVQLRAPPGTPLLTVRLQLDRLGHWGIRPMDAVEAIRIAYEGAVVGETFEANRIFDVVVVLDPAMRLDPEHLPSLPLRALDGTIVRLGEIAEIDQTGGRYSILHRGTQRVQSVTGNVEGRDLSSFFDELQEAVLEEVDFSSSTYPEFTGAAVVRAQSRQQLIAHSMIAGIGVLLLIYLAIRRFRNVVLILVNVPFSLVGGVIAVLLTGGLLSVGSMVGFVTLFGITVRNSIMLVSHYRHLVDREQLRWNADTAIKGAQERLPSILMTALVTALAMLPIAVNSDNAGREIMGPMAAVIIGGLASSTLLNLLILPTIMLHYGDFSPAASPMPDGPPRGNRPAAEP